MHATRMDSIRCMQKVCSKDQHHLAYIKSMQQGSKTPNVHKVHIERVQWRSKTPSVHRKCTKRIKNVCNEDWKHVVCIKSTRKGLITHDSEMIERTKHKWKEMEDQERLKGDGSGVVKKEKVWKKKSSQHGTKPLLFKKNHQRLANSHNAITYNTRATTRSP